MKFRLFATLISALLGAALMAQSSTLPYQDPSLSPRQRAEDLCQRLTLKEKVSLLLFESPQIADKGIPEFNWWSEALHGVGRNGLATVFPITMGLASTWNDSLVLRCFDVTSTEARAKNNMARREGHSHQYEGLSFWTPNINIFRDPRWGRGQETYGEDPYLTARMGLAVVSGLQGPEGHKYQKLLACAKHFAVHSGPEWSRHRMDIQELPQRDLWETYLPAFKALVQEGHVAEIMCAYQSLEGEPCCGNSRLLQQILRDEWGFEGLVTSDCWAVNDFWVPGRHNFKPNQVEGVSHAVRSGTDLECGNSFGSLVEGVEKGLVSEAEIDRSLIRLLTARFLLGDFDGDELVEWKQIPSTVIDAPGHRRLALEAARQSIVLLQNRDNLLPLQPDQQLLVVGHNAVDSTMQWGNYNGFPSHTETILSALRLRQPAELRFCDYPLVQTYEEAAQDTLIKFREITRGTSPETHVVVFVGGISPRLEGEEMPVKYPGFHGGDRTSIELPDAQRSLLRKFHQAGYRVVMVNCSGSAVALEPETRYCDAILQAWYPGQNGGTAVADVLYGDYNPSGKLPVTFYSNTAQLPDYEDYRMQGRTYRYLTDAPLWHFGYGLSYTTFKVDKVKFRGGVLSLRVSNRGQRDGAEVVQVYLRRPDDPEGPQRTLRAFRRVEVKAGESVRVEIPMDDASFEWWNPQTNTITSLPGRFELQVGTSSRPEDLQTLRITRN